MVDGQGTGHRLGRAAQAVGGIYRVHDGGTAFLGDHDGHDLPLGVELQVVGLFQVFQAGQAALDDGPPGPWRWT